MSITDITRETLRGLKGVVVVVETLKPDAEADGLSLDVIQSEVEQRLSSAGIRILPHQEWRITGGRPWLYVSINTMKFLFSHFFAIDVQLKQDVSLPREPSIVTSSATWEMGSVGIVSVSDLANKIRDSVNAHVDNFIKDFKAVNK